MANKRIMRESRELWKEMDSITQRKDYLPAEKAVSIAGLLVRCFREDMVLIAGCTDEMNAVSTQTGVDTAQGRVFICFTGEDKARAQAGAATWAVVPAKEIIGNILARQDARAIAFNTDSESVMIPVQYLRMLIPEA